MNEVRQFETESGDCPFSDWFDGLPAEAADRVDTVLERMKQGNLGDHKRVGEGVFERRISHGPGYRVYFVPCRSQERQGTKEIDFPRPCNGQP